MDGNMPGLLDGTEPVGRLLCRVANLEAGDDFLILRANGVADGKFILPKQPCFETARGFAPPIGGAANDVGVEDDGHRRAARTSRMASATTASSSAVGSGCERLRSSKAAHCSGVRG